MPRGPLPNPQSRRRNKPSIESAELQPRTAPAPELPEAYDLGIAGAAFWDWAWSLPQASRWDDGSAYFVARRAALEDDLLALDEADRLSDVIDEMVAEAVVEDDPMQFKTRLVQLTLTLKKLKALAGGRVGVMKEMRELDNRLGLNPKALGDLRWVLPESDAQPVTDPAGESSNSSMTVKAIKAELKRRGVRHGANAKKADLVKLLNDSEAATVTRIDAYRDRLS